MCPVNWSKPNQIRCKDRLQIFLNQNTVSRVCHSGNKQVARNQSVLAIVSFSNLTVWHRTPIDPGFLVNVCDTQKLRADLFIFRTCCVSILRLMAHIPQRLHLPPFRDLPQLRIDHPVRKEVVEVGRHAGQGLAAAPAAVHLGAHRVEVDEPGFEQRAGHLLQPSRSCGG